MKNAPVNNEDLKIKKRIDAEFEFKAKENYAIYLLTMTDLLPASKFYTKNDLLDVKMGSRGNIIATGDRGICGFVNFLHSQNIIHDLKGGRLFCAKIINITDTWCRIRFQTII